MGESVSKLTIDAGVQGGAAAAGELQKVAASIDATGAAAQAAGKQAEELARLQGVLGRELSFAAESAKTAAEAIAQSDAAETLRLQAEAAELARPAIEALAEAQQRVAQLQAEQAKGPAGRSVGEMLAFNDAIAKQEGLIRTLGGEQQQFNTKTQDLVGILNRINPRLGEIGLGLIRLSRLTGDVATTNLSWGKSIESVGQFLKGNVASIALLGAGYLAYAAISRAYDVWKKDAEDLAKAAEEAKRYEQALADLNKQRNQQQQSIEDIAGRRKGGGFKDADEARAAQQQAERIRQRFPQLPESTVNEVVGNLAGSGLSDEAVTRAAIAAHQNRLKFRPNASIEKNVRAVNEAERKGGSRTDDFIRVETQQKVEAARIVATAGSKDGIQDIEGIKTALEQILPGVLGKVENLDLLARAFANRSAIAGDQTRALPEGVIETNEEHDAKKLKSLGFTESLPVLEAVSRQLETIARAAQTIVKSGSRGGGDNYFTGPVQLQGSGPITNGQTRASEAGE